MALLMEFEEQQLQRSDLFVVINQRKNELQRSDLIERFRWVIESCERKNVQICIMCKSANGFLNGV
jgi:hypothetical protein